MERAFNLGLAGILGDKVYNFGELVSYHMIIYGVLKIKLKYFN